MVLSSRMTLTLKYFPRSLGILTTITRAHLWVFVVSYLLVKLSAGYVNPRVHSTHIPSLLIPLCCVQRRNEELRAMTVMLRFA